MAALTIKFNYVQDYAVLLREDFIKYVGTILVRKMPKGCHAEITDIFMDSHLL